MVFSSPKNLCQTFVWKECYKKITLTVYGDRTTATTWAGELLSRPDAIKISWTNISSDSICASACRKIWTIISLYKQNNMPMLRKCCNCTLWRSRMYENCHFCDSAVPKLVFHRDPMACRAFHLAWFTDTCSLSWQVERCRRMTCHLANRVELFGEVPPILEI